MPSITINWIEADAYCSDMKDYQSRLDSCADDTRSVNKDLSMRVANEENLKARLEQAANKIETCQADMLTMYTVLSTACGIYKTSEMRILVRIMPSAVSAVIESTPVGFFDWVDDKINDFRTNWMDGVSILKDKFSEDGEWYDELQIGKSVVRTGIGLVKFVGGTIELLGTGGLASPIAVLTIISGINDTVNGITDIALGASGFSDQVGSYNMLKDSLVENAGIIGGYFGNTEFGESAGKVIYGSIGLTLGLDGVSTLLDHCDAVTQAASTDYYGLMSELDNLPANINGLLSTNVSEVAYQAKLLSYEIPEMVNSFNNIEIVKGLGQVFFDFKDTMETFGNVVTNAVVGATAAG